MATNQKSREFESLRARYLLLLTSAKALNRFGLLWIHAMLFLETPSQPRAVALLEAEERVAGRAA
jgi:hypothetical protein